MYVPLERLQEACATGAHWHVISFICTRVCRDRETERQRDRETERQRENQYSQRGRGREGGRERRRERERKRERKREREKERKRERETTPTWKLDSADRGTIGDIVIRQRSLKTKPQYSMKSQSLNTKASIGPTPIHEY